jgi:phage tail-like protein
VTCGPVPTTFRILDRHTEWELDLAPTAVTIGDVIELAKLDAAAVDPDDLAGVMAPPWIAHGCGCDWFIICPPHSVLRYGPRVTDCDDDPCLGWTPIAGGGCHVELIEPVAIAAAGDRIAILDRGRGEVLVLTAGGDRVVASFATDASGPIAFAGTGLLVANGRELARFDLVTLSRSDLPAAPRPVARLVFVGGIVWAALDAGGGALDLERLVDGAWQDGPLDALVASAPSTGLASASDERACLEIPRGGGEPRLACIDRCGNPAPAPDPAPAPLRETAGSVTTKVLIDSEIPRCRWHRVRIDLEMPERTSVAVFLVTREAASTPVAAGDWQPVQVTDLVKPVPGRPLLTCDFLIDQPPGRYLDLRVDLRGDGRATPRIHRIRLDFPRSTSATRLPGVFREDPVASDFLERFLAIFDASVEDLDRIIERFPALVDPSGAPAEALAWLGTFSEIVLDPSWSVDARRAILEAAPELYRRRGTPWAVSRAIELAIGVAPAIEELGATIPFARLGAFRINDSRLFGRARARFRLGASAIGAAPLRAYGDPDRDHVAALGWRVVVQVPNDGSPELATRLRRLVDAQKPAHIAAAVRVGGELALLGIESAVGIDTRLGGLPAPALGTNTRLGRRTVLARGTRRGGAEITAGVAAALGIQTVLS